MTIEGVSTDAPISSSPPCILNTVHTTNDIMTKQESFQAARNVITAKRSDITRKGLQTAAMANGRSAEQVTKASTMRLAFWASVGKSAI